MFKISIIFATVMIFGETLTHSVMIIRFRMRDKEMRNLTVGSLLFGALKLPCQCCHGFAPQKSAKYGKKKLKIQKNI